MPVAVLMAGWRPGSHGDDWTWDDERRDLYESAGHRSRTLAVEASILAEGVREPVLLGSDGRVWDGHHRVVIAFVNDIVVLPVEHA